MIQSDWSPSKKRSGHRLTQREDHVMTQEKTVISMPKRDASGETVPADTLILDFQPLVLESIHFCFQVPQPEGLGSGPEPSDTAVGTVGAEI